MERTVKFVTTEQLMADVEKDLAKGLSVWMYVRGGSMRPFMRDMVDRLQLRSPRDGELRPGAVVLARTGADGHYVIHRIVSRRGSRLVLQGDGNAVQRERTSTDRVVAVVSAIERGGRTYPTEGLVWRTFSAVWRRVVYVRRAAHLLRRQLGYLRSLLVGHGRGLVLSTLIGLVGVALSLLFIYLSKCTIDAATTPAHAVPWQTYAAALGVTCVLIILCGAADTWVSVRLQVGAGNALRHRLFASVLRSSWGGLARFHTGDVVNRVERDASSVSTMLTATIPTIVVTAVQFAAAFLLFCYLDARLPWLVLALLPLFLLGGRYYSRRMYRYSRRIRTGDSRVQAVLQESLQQRGVVQALEQGERRLALLDARQSLLRRDVLRRARFSVGSRACVSAAFATGYLAAFLWGVAGIGAGAITFGTMAAFLQLVGKVQRPVIDLARLVPSIVEALASTDRLREIEDVPAERITRRIFLPTVPDVELTGVTFRYARGARPVLSELTCRFPAGAHVAIMGPTGRGKTTLVRLLLALVEQQEGSIRLCCGEQAVDVSPATRCNFTYVPQGGSLLSGSVRDNLRMGRPDADDAAMLRALHTAAADFVLTLPGGLSATLGEQGRGLSEGQAQRIAVARALLREGHILLLDEATSALDAATEQQLLDGLRRDYAGRTVIFVTHHESVAARCDVVIRL